MINYYETCTCFYGLSPELFGGYIGLYGCESMLASYSCNQPGKSANDGPLQREVRIVAMDLYSRSHYPSH